MNIALFGNPNTGKTSLFNMLTGSYEYVGNWTGVTVEKKVGILRDKWGQLIDLPGVYSLSPVSKDEGVATQFLLHEKFDSILNIIDASGLERNLQLTVQLLEFGKPVFVALNMIDVARGRGINIDVEKLASSLGTSVIPIVARTGEGCLELTKKVKSTRLSSTITSLRIDYGPALEPVIERMVQSFSADCPLPKRWLALQFLEGNQAIGDSIRQYSHPSWLLEMKEEAEINIQQLGLGKSLQSYIRKVRADFISHVLGESVSKSKEQEQYLSQKIDAIVTHKFLGMPLFLLFMFLIFKLTFDWLGSPLSDQLDAFMTGPLSAWMEAGLVKAGASPLIQAVILEGIISGVGGVLVFVPQIFILFFFISFIEDSGYMARVAMVMDRLMEHIGLNGKAFIPMIIGFGCNVPGVMAARTIEQPKERLLTILLTPLMSCSARLPVYSLFVGAFFVRSQAFVVLSLYVLGIVVALILAKLFSSTILKQESSFFIVELPPYRFPQWRTLMRSTWEKGKGFVKKAGTIIFGGSVVIWFLSYAGPSGLDVDMNHSYLASIGGVVAPLFAPIGFGNWQAGAALLTGFFAKEVVVSTMNIIYASPNLETLQGIMAGYFTPLQAFSFMTFILLYVPCLATVSVIRKETASVRWTWFAVGYALVIAYSLCLVIYQVGQWLGYH